MFVQDSTGGIWVGRSSVGSTARAGQLIELDLRCLLDGLGIERPILVGHSFGADIAMYFSLLYLEKSNCDPVF